MKNLYLLNLITVGVVFLSSFDTVAAASGNLADRTKLQQQQLQQQLQAVAAAAAQQQKQQQQSSSIQSSHVSVPVQPPVVSSSVQQQQQQQHVNNPAPVVPTTKDFEQQTTDVQLNPKWCQVHLFKKSRVTWLEAYRTCRDIGNGTELASIKTEEDFKTLNSKVKEAGSPASVIYWTSGTDLIDEGEFFWMVDGTEVKNTYWGPGQPDNHWESEHCIALKRYPHETNYKMTDENCLMAGAFVCVQPCKFWV